jgi:hypothetical protein
MRILILEDNPVDADLSRIAIIGAFENCTVEIAPTLKNARELLDKGLPYQLALLDMNLPDGYGLELLSEIRKKELEMAVVVFTATGNEEVAVAALKAGANDYIAKRTGYTEHLPTVMQSALKNNKQLIQQQNEAIGVLYIEHNSIDIDLTNRHLKKYAPNIQLEIVSTAEAALRLILKENGADSCLFNYRVILMDYRLQGMSTLDFIKIIRQEIKIDTPIIIVTGQGDEEIAAQALRLGATDYITKGENYLFRLPTLIQSACQQGELKHKQAELAESEAKYRLIAENSGDVIFTLDMNLNYTYVSPAVKAMRGYEPEEAIKQKIEEVLTPESYQRAVKLISESLIVDHKLLSVHLAKHIIELEMIRNDRTTIWTEVLASLIVDDNDNPIGILGVSRDISKRKAALDELRKLSRAVEQSPDSVIITNLKGEIEYCNPSVVNISGYSKDEIIGENPRIFSSGNKTKDEYQLLWHTIIKGAIWEGEFQNKKKNGELYWEATTISPVTNSLGKITHYLAIRKDITEQKQLMQELIKAKDKAEESDRLKTAFINNISHEIRTPLNSILGFGQFLAESEHSFDERIEYFNILQKSSNRLMNTVNDYMDMAMIVSGTMEIHKKEFHLQPFFEKIIEDKKQLCTDNNIDFELHIPSEPSDLIINSDQDFLRKILVIFLDNALKFTKYGTISCGYRIDSDFLEFFVQDTGKGIDVDKIEIIFDIFSQEDVSNTRGYEGSGLGLAIAKGLVKLLGGSISVISEKGKGSTFTFTIPYAVPALTERPSVEKKMVSTDISKLLVLIAEDEESNYFYMEAIMKMIGCKYVHAINGAEALKMCKQNKKINLVLMDVKMPVMSGLEATQLIREFRPELPIIATTAYAQIGDEHRFLAAGCDGYLAKPIRKDNLLVLLQKYT